MDTVNIGEWRLLIAEILFEGLVLQPYNKKYKLKINRFKRNIKVLKALSARTRRKKK